MTTKSTLNSKLGRVSEIRFCTAAGKNMATKLFTQENATFSVKLGCKQPSKKSDPYQVQYRLRSRYTAANAKAKGADWTKWSAWKNMIAFGSGGSAVPMGSTKDADEWLKSNKGINTKSSYMTFYTFPSTKVAGDYDARQYQVRIRTYNAKTRKHGAWVTQTLVVYKAAVVANETIHRGAGGQLMLDCNYIWSRGGTVHVNSVKDSTGRNILNAAVTCSMNRDAQRTANTTPALRTGYTPGEFEVTVGAKGLKRALAYGEKLTWNAWYQTKDGAKTYFTSPITVSRQDTTINTPRVTSSTDYRRGWLLIKAYKTDADDVVERASCSIDYVYKGKTYTVKPDKASLNLSVQSTTTPMATWTFKRLPFGTSLDVKVTVGNDYHSTRTVHATTQVNMKLFMLSNASIYAALAGNAELNVKGQAKMTSGLPHGRRKPFAAYTLGDETTITLTGVVPDTSAGWPAAYVAAIRGNWETIRNNQGVYLLRSPDGMMFDVAVYEIGMRQDQKSLITVDVTALEVS